LGELVGENSTLIVLPLLEQLTTVVPKVQVNGVTILTSAGNTNEATATL
jgi:hypothetical protein